MTDPATEAHRLLGLLRQRSQTLSPAANRKLAQQLKEISDGIKRHQAERAVDGFIRRGTNGHRTAGERQIGVPYSPHVQQERARAGGGSQREDEWT